jgi:uncharacterized membrane protein YesL
MFDLKVTLIDYLNVALIDYLNVTLIDYLSVALIYIMLPWYVTSLYIMSALLHFTSEFDNCVTISTILSTHVAKYDNMPCGWSLAKIGNSKWPFLFHNSQNKSYM